MAFKGVAWAGDVYQKFEAMCLEVEEVMYQDTVKYVDNQVQKVGVSVKKFYSEVMQDLLPPSCVDPVKVAAGDLSLNPYGHTDLSQKPESFLLDSPRELKKLKIEDEAISDTPLCSGVLVQNTSSDLCSSKVKKLGVHRRPIGIKRISRLDRPSKEVGPETSLLGLGSSETVSCGGSGILVKASSDMNLKSSSDSVKIYDPEPVNGSSPVSDVKIKSSVAEKLVSAVSVRQKKDESECASVTKKLVPAGSARQNKDESSRKLISAGSVSQKKDETECTSVIEKLVSAGSVRQKKDKSERASVTEKLLLTKSVRQKKDESDRSSVTEKLVSAGSVGEKKDETECTSVTDKLVSAGSMRQKKDESERATITEKLVSAGFMRHKKDESERSSVTEKLVSTGSVGHKKDETECTYVIEKLVSARSVRQNKDESECSGIAEKLVSAVSVRQKKDETECTSVKEKLESAGSERQKKDESECTTPLGKSSNGSLISHMGLNNAINEGYIESFCEKVTASDEDTNIKNDSHFVSSPDNNSTTCDVESAVEEVLLSDKDYFDMEAIQDEEVAEPRIETFDAFEGRNMEETRVFEAFEGSNLEETCVLVEGGDLDFVSLGNRKHKSYKKKIRDALSSKLRSIRKEGHKDSGGKNNPKERISALSIEPARKLKPTDDDSLESEWELL